MHTDKENIKNNHHASAGNSGKAFFQPKLTVSQPNDIYEQEADHMADKVLRMTDNSVHQNTFFKPANNAVQRKCQSCEEGDKFVHRKEAGEGEVPGSNELDNYVSSLSSTGQPMPESSRILEPRFGHDFSNVRIHNDAIAAKSAQSINALAYTTGNNIVFNNNQFAPATESGQRLLAHELTHVIQQGAQKPAVQRHRALDATESAPCLAQAEQVIQALEKNMLAGSNYGQQDYIKGAVKTLRDKMGAGKIKCYAFTGLVHGEDDYSGDEIRLDGINLNWVNESTLLHEGVHAYQASQHSATATQYAAALKSQRPIDGKKPADLKLLKWKAWTEYWAYRAKSDYYNPTRKVPMSEDDIDNNVMSNPDVGNPTRLVRQFDSSFNPKTYTPSP